MFQNPVLYMQLNASIVTGPEILIGVGNISGVITDQSLCSRVDTLYLHRCQVPSVIRKCESCRIPRMKMDK